MDERRPPEAELEIIMEMIYELAEGLVPDRVEAGEWLDVPTQQEIELIRRRLSVALGLGIP